MSDLVVARPEGSVLPAGWLLHRSLAARGAGSHHPRARRPRPRRPRPLSCVARGRAGHARAPARRPSADARVRRDPSPGRRVREPSSCRPRARLRAAAHRASRRSVGRLRRLLHSWRAATRAARARRSSRCAATVHHRVDVRPADLSLGAAGRGVRGRSTRGGAANATRRPCERPVRATRSARRSACSRASMPIGPIFVHGAVDAADARYRAAGVALPADAAVDRDAARHRLRRRARRRAAVRTGTPWLRRFGDYARRLRERLDAGPRRATASRASIAASCCAITPTGRDCCAASRHRRRARDRHARLREPRSSAGSREQRLSRRAHSRPSTATRTTSADDAAGEEVTAMKRFAALYAELDATTATTRRSTRCRATSARRRRRTRRGRCTSSPAASRGRSCRRSVMHALACERAGIAAVALRRVLRSRRRPRGDRRARAACRRRSASDLALARVGRRAPAAAARRGSGDAARRASAHVLGRARPRRAVRLEQAHHRRASASACRSCSCSARSPRRSASTPSVSRSGMMGYTDARATPAPRAFARWSSASEADGERRAAVSVLPRPSRSTCRGELDARSAPPATGMPSGSGTASARR